MAQPPAQLLDQAQAAGLIGVPVRTLQFWRGTGKPALPYVRLSYKVVRYRLEDVEAFVRGRLAAPGRPTGG